jgi:precorrin-3B methylase
LDRTGSLVVVGVGFSVPAHVTAEARECIETSDEVLYLVPDPVAARWIEDVAPGARPLHDAYEPGVHRAGAYESIVERILEPVRAGADVCVVFYGHPGVFVMPSHEAIRRARVEGFDARMLPGISADACLFADLGIDPSTGGCQSYEATDLLVHARRIDPTAALVVWQAGAVGNRTYAPDGDTSQLHVLADYLLRLYPPAHPVVLYEASAYAIVPPLVRTVALSELATSEPSPMTTLYVEPLPSAPDSAMLERLGLASGDDVDAARAATTLPFSS